MSSHDYYMRLCLGLARQAIGKTSPNPMVGAVVVRDGQIVGQGFHPQAGQPHAEVYALKEAGELARGATLYVNLEPCNHYGRTPPCTEALISAGVERVVVGMVDPDERVQGRGIQRLREAGIEVVYPVIEAECLRLNEAFVYRSQHKLPLGILKYAMTLDGKIAANSGHSSWVTGPEARQWVHRLRSTCDAVVIGGNTLRRDNPLLTTHGQTDHNPLRVVMSRSFNLPSQAQLWDTKVAPTVVFTLPEADPLLASQISSLGVEVVRLGTLDPLVVMQSLYDRGCSVVLWEGGGSLAASAISLGIIQKVYAYIAPKIIGGTGQFSPVGDLGLSLMTEAIDLKDFQLHTIGRDILIEGYLDSPAPTQGSNNISS